MSCMPDMMPMSLAAAVVPHTSKIIKNGFSVFERGDTYIATKWYTTLCISQTNLQKSSYKARTYTDKKLTFLKRAWFLKG